MADTTPEIDLDSVIDRLLEGKSLSRPGLGPRWRLLCAFNNHQASVYVKQPLPFSQLVVERKRGNALDGCV